MTLALGTSLDQRASRRRCFDGRGRGLSGEVVVSDVRPMSAVARRRRRRAGGDDVAAGDDGRPGAGAWGALASTACCRSWSRGRPATSASAFALGAQRRDVFWLVIKEGATLCGAGIAIGFAGALAVTRWLSSELYGISPTDPATYAAVASCVARHADGVLRADAPGDGRRSPDRSSRSVTRRRGRNRHNYLVCGIFMLGTGNAAVTTSDWPWVFSWAPASQK